MKNEFEDLDNYQNMLRALIIQLEKDIAMAPKGRLRIANKEKRTNYYHCKEGVGTSADKGEYLGRQCEEFIRDLAQKDYDQRLLREAALQQIRLDNIPDNIGKRELINVYESLPESRKKLVSPRIKSKADAITEWLAISYEHMGFEDGTPEIYTDAHERVRSKSEKLIAEKLRSMGVPYKYECPVYLTGYGVVFPDFTILNKNTMEVCYLEHLGRMDDPEYAGKAVAKVRNYERTGIYVGRNLFLTMEAKATPFDASCIEAMFKDFV